MGVVRVVVLGLILGGGRDSSCIRGGTRDGTRAGNRGVLGWY